jgi:hypothetical protein
MSRPPEGATPAEPARYELRVQGVLEPRWSGWFEGLQVSSDDRGETTIAGPVTERPCTACSPRSATWACRCWRSAASTKIASTTAALGC